MEVTSIESFLAFYERTRQTTNKVVQVIPPHQLDWTYATGKFTVGDQVRHIAAIERNLFAEMVQGNKISYRGCGKELADGYDNIVHYFHQMHQESVAIFKQLSNDDLGKTIASVNGQPTSIRHFLRALVIHEIHHRAALCVYLNILGVKTPALFGVTAEDLLEKTKSFST